jgi:hypothetical protein
MRRLAMVFGLVAIAAAVAVAYFAVVASFHWIRSTDSNLSGAIVTAVLGLVGIGYAQWHSKSRDIAESHRSAKIEVYNTFFEIVERFQSNVKLGAEFAEEDISDSMKKDFARLHRGLILWGSPDVIRAWLKFRMAASGGENILIAVDEMYRAIRKDLGNSNFGLRVGDLLKITLSDPHEWEKTMQKP